MLTDRRGAPLSIVVTPANTHGQDRSQLFEYIEMFYNNQRLHAYLDYVSPALFERLSLQKAA